jgi:hypothetical protein
MPGSCGDDRLGAGFWYPVVPYSVRDLFEHTGCGKASNQWVRSLAITRKGWKGVRVG